jgi:hypothetical protein
MTVKPFKRERDTVLAALRRWLSYSAAREADSIASNAGKHKPLDNSEIERLCKRVAKIETKHGEESLFRPSHSDIHKRKVCETRDHLRTGSRRSR